MEVVADTLLNSPTKENIPPFGGVERYVSIAKTQREVKTNGFVTSRGCDVKTAVTYQANPYYAVPLEENPVNDYTTLSTKNKTMDESFGKAKLSIEDAEYEESKTQQCDEGSILKNLPNVLEVKKAIDKLYDKIEELENENKKLQNENGNLKRRLNIQEGVFREHINKLESEAGDNQDNKMKLEEKIKKSVNLLAECVVEKKIMQKEIATLKREKDWYEKLFMKLEFRWNDDIPDDEKCFRNKDAIKKEIKLKKAKKNYLSHLKQVVIKNATRGQKISNGGAAISKDHQKRCDSSVSDIVSNPSHDNRKSDFKSTEDFIAEFKKYSMSSPEEQYVNVIIKPKPNTKISLL